MKIFHSAKLKYFNIPYFKITIVSYRYFAFLIISKTFALKKVFTSTVYFFIWLKLILKDNNSQLSNFYQNSIKMTNKINR